MSSPVPTTPARRLRRLAGAAVVVVALAGCGGGEKGGDPGGKRLHELAADPVFTAVPPGATAVRRTETPAEYRDPGFGSGGWAGPGVVLAFASSAPPAAVYRFYARAAGGWHPTATGALGLTDRWEKTFPDGAPATLGLAQLTPGRYRLTGGIAPVAS